MAAVRRLLTGIAASPGVAVGPAVVAARSAGAWPRHRIEDKGVFHHLERLRSAVESSRYELEEIRDRLGADAPADYRLILDAHMLMHSDELLIDGASKAIREGLINAEWAVERAVGVIKNHLKQAPHAYFRDRAQDVEHVGRRIIAQLVGRQSSLPPIHVDGVLVVDDLHPADAARLIESPVVALVTGLGTATSHTAILARTLEIPSVVGVAGIATQVGAGDVLIVDALQGRIVVSPESDEAEQARVRATRYHHFKAELRAHGVRTVTKDGEELSLMANVDLPEEVELAMKDRVAGIGLYRTEFLYINRSVPPDEEEQLAVYRRILDTTGNQPLVLRTFDLGGDNLTTGQATSATPNPALGLRAIRLALQQKSAFYVQLRAILRAATAGDVRLMFPLISGLADLRAAKAALQEARDQLSSAGLAFGEVAVGIMIELPSAVTMVDKLASEVDFMAVGTNDLVQYALAVDRSNPEVAYLADALDPAVLRMLQRVSRVARDTNTPLSMCGDMAANPVSLPIVAGLGYRTLSLPLSALPLAREVVRGIALDHSRAVTNIALECATAQEVRAVLKREFGATLQPLWEEAGVAP